MFKTSIELKGGNFNTDERNVVKQRLFDQLEDSARVVIIDKLFLFHKATPSAAYDTAYSFRSARNMIGSMLHLGYYQAKDSIKIDTVSGTFFSSYSFKFEKQQRVSVKYIIDAGNPTLIDTIIYKLKKPDLQLLAEKAKPASFILKSTPVTKANIIGEISRMVILYRNNGYYKFSSDDLKMRGDTTILSLTNISDDPFENIRLLAEANEKRNKPTIKLDMILNPLADTMRLQKFYINNIYIYPDYSTSDTINDLSYKEDTAKRNGYLIRYHKKLFRNGF